MPVVRYFLFVGGALLALLLISDAYLPKLPAAERADADLPVIRIHSDRKWPERVVFDTSHPTIVAAHIANMTASIPAPATTAGIAPNPRVREAFAQLQPSDIMQVPSPDPRKLAPKPQRKRTVAVRRAVPAPMQLAQQPQFGLFGNNTW
jgi:hypothetical protein